MRVRGFVPVVIPFRLRAATLAIASLGIGVLCFMSAIKGCMNPSAPAAAPEVRVDPGWPPGFVELNADAPPSSFAAPSASALPAAPVPSAK